MNWKEVAQAKRASNELKIPAEWKLEKVPSPEELPDAFEYINSILPQLIVELTLTPAVDILAQIANGKLSAVEVTKAFCHRAALSQQLTNCCSEIFFDKLIRDAEALDKYFAENGKVIGPLHGLPISLKDQVNLPGIDTSIGYTAAFISDEYQRKITGRCKEDDVESLIATILRENGAIFYVKTTVPMAMMASDTTTTLFGPTLNGRNRHFSPGGSSGGEGALVASGGSLIGFGTDIGGSIRIPSSFNGIYGLRPSSNRIPYLDVANSMAHQPIVPSVIGPMCRYLQDLEMITKVVIDSEPWERDVKVPPITWRKFEADKAFNFGVVEFDGVVTPHPAFKRALGIAKKALLKLGHDVFDFEAPVPHGDIVDLVNSIFILDSMEEISGFAKLADEPIGDVVLDLCGPPYKDLSVSDHWSQAKLKYEYQQSYNKGWLESSKLTKNGEVMDAMLIPSWSSTSFKVGRHAFSPSTYTEVFNGLDYSIVVIPVTTVDAKVDKYPEGYEPLNAKDEINFKEYDPESYHGMPVCLQLVVRKYQEEKAIELAKLVVKALN